MGGESAMTTGRHPHLAVAGRRGEKRERPQIDGYTDDAVARGFLFIMGYMEPTWMGTLLGVLLMSWDQG